MFFTTKRELQLLDKIYEEKEKLLIQKEKYKNLEVDMLLQKKSYEQTIELMEKKHKQELDQISSQSTIELTNKNNDLKIELATAKANIAQLEKIVDINADIYDIKNIINKIVEKLPTINLTSLSASTNKE